MHLRRWAVGFVLSLALSWHSTSDATVVLAIPVARLVDLADWVVVGKVTSVDCHYVVIGGAERTVTDSVVEVDHLVSSKDKTQKLPSQTITVRTLGGTIDGISELVFGEAVLREGSSTMLFLKQQAGDNLFRLPAMAQGEYILKKDAQGETRLFPSPGLDVIVHPEQSAVAALSGRTLKQAETLIAAVAGKVRTLP